MIFNHKESWIINEVVCAMCPVGKVKSLRFRAWADKENEYNVLSTANLQWIKTAINKWRSQWESRKAGSKSYLEMKGIEMQGSSTMQNEAERSKFTEGH